MVVDLGDRVGFRFHHHHHHHPDLREDRKVQPEDLPDWQENPDDLPHFPMVHGKELVISPENEDRHPVSAVTAPVAPAAPAADSGIHVYPIPAGSPFSTTKKEEESTPDHRLSASVRMCVTPQTRVQLTPLGHAHEVLLEAATAQATFALLTPATARPQMATTPEHSTQLAVTPEQSVLVTLVPSATPALSPAPAPIAAQSQPPPLLYTVHSLAMFYYSHAAATAPCILLSCMAKLKNKNHDDATGDMSQKKSGQPSQFTRKHLKFLTKHIPAYIMASKIKSSREAKTGGLQAWWPMFFAQYWIRFPWRLPLNEDPSPVPMPEPETAEEAFKGQDLNLSEEEQTQKTVILKDTKALHHLHVPTNAEILEMLHEERDLYTMHLRCMSDFEWKEVVEYWWGLEKQSKFTKSYPMMYRPKAVGAWMKNARKGMPNIGSTTQMQGEWRAWWRAINPKWFLNIIVCLKWWFFSMEMPSEVWKCAVKDVKWVLERMLEEDSMKTPRTHSPASERAANPAVDPAPNTPPPSAAAPAATTSMAKGVGANVPPPLTAHNSTSQAPAVS
ncbi:hypothetical protein B0H19DRAFT_1257048 [Mycena capillaripes]|nr:hypothetical protein B0H19DRAFT_1257048 [Mycena capillaripes]